jgi:hypothetical protein
MWLRGEREFSEAAIDHACAAAQYAHIWANARTSITKAA